MRVPLDRKKIKPVNPKPTLMLGKFEGGRRREWQRMRWWDSIADAMDMNSHINQLKLQEMVMHRESKYAVAHGLTKSWTRLRD